MGHAIQAEAIHPDLWRASQLSSAGHRTLSSGHVDLDRTTRRRLANGIAD
jgi:hypothetical protein